MENNNKKQHQRDDSNKKESTSSGGNDDGSSTSASKPKDILHDDVCSICMDDVSILDVATFQICFECGKVMHRKCAYQLRDTKSLNNECPMCRAKCVPRGSKESIERLQRWSQRGKSWAQFGLGNLYREGLGVKKRPKRAFDLCKLAADQGHHLAQYNLAMIYTIGQGVKQSDELAFKYYKLSAEQEHAKAQFYVGAGYYMGTGVEESFTEAKKWLNKQTSKFLNYLYSFYLLFRLYIHGGEDIMSGHLDNMWCIDLSDLTEFTAGSSEYTENPEW